MNKRIKYSEYYIHIIGIIPAIVLSFLFFTHSLSINPIESLERQTGRVALVFLFLSLACSPLNKIFSIDFLVRWRKLLGLYAFLYAFIHLLIFTGLDYGFQFLTIWNEIQGNYFIWFGAAGFVLLIPVALTSTRYWQKRLGEKWKILHRLVFCVVLFVMIHFFLAGKGDVISLQGNILLPLVFTIALLGLLILRIPLVQKTLIQWQQKIFSRRNN